MQWFTLLLVLLKLVPLVLELIRDEKQKGIGRDQLVESVVKKFNVVNGQAVAARRRTRDRIAADGVRGDTTFRRDN